MNELVSIIIPTYNRKEFLGATLDSILAQTYEDWECIIVDDGSTDGTFKLLNEYAKKDKRIKYFERPSERPKGANACRNYGFQLSKGKYINWFDSDDLMAPDKLEKQVAELEDSKMDLCVCQTLVFKESIDKNLGLRHHSLKSENFWDDYLMFKILWLTQAPIWKRDFLLKMDTLFDEDLQAAQEWEFHLRALNRLKDYSVIETPLVFLREHEESISKGNREEVLWFYFLARHKIFIQFRNNLSSQSKQFLRRYFLNVYKNALRTGQMKLAWKIYKKNIMRNDELSLKSRLRLGLGCLSYLLCKRGDVFIRYVN